MEDLRVSLRGTSAGGNVTGGFEDNSTATSRRLVAGWAPDGWAGGVAAGGVAASEGLAEALVARAESVISTISTLGGLGIAGEAGLGVSGFVTGAWLAPAAEGAAAERDVRATGAAGMA